MHQKYQEKGRFMLYRNNIAALLIILFTSPFCFANKLQNLGSNHCAEYITTSTSSSFCVPYTQPLDFIVKYALNQNPGILRSGAETDASVSEVRVAQGGFFPQGNVKFFAGNERYFAGNPSNETNMPITNSQVAIDQPVFDGFSTFNLVKQRKEESKSAAYNESFAKENLALDAVTGYTNVIKFNQLRDLTAKNIVSHIETLDKIRKKVEGGAGQQPDLDLAIGRLAQKRATLENVNGALEIAKANFVRIVGFSPHKLFLPSAPAIPKTLSEAENIAVTTNPALLSAQASLNAADRAVSVAKANLSPQVDLEANMQSGTNLSGVPGPTKDKQGIVIVNYNFLNGGSDVANISKAKQLRMAALYNYNDIKTRVIENVDKAWDQLQADNLSLIAVQQHVDASAAVLTHL
jgi:adhesin transport system outer membrane protein